MSIDTEIIISRDDTICAVSTPPGCGGIAVIRVCGPETLEICKKVWRGKDIRESAPRTALYGKVIDSEGDTLDECIATYFPGPGSFTGQDTVEFAVHGSKYIQLELIKSLINAGARTAGPGEFTSRAFMAGKIDLLKVEAIADLIASTSRENHRLAIGQLKGNLSNAVEKLHDKLLNLATLLELELDFSEEDVEFANREELRATALEILKLIENLKQSYSTASAIKNGIPVVITGQPNVGKSTLLNALAQDDKAIVSSIPGTTRDIIEEVIDIQGIEYRLIDTAGIRESVDTIEKIGIAKALDAVAKARVVLWLIDGTSDYTSLPDCPLAPESEAVVIPVITKSLVAPEENIKNIEWLLGENYKGLKAIRISAEEGSGIDELKEALANAANIRGIDSNQGVLTTLRQYETMALAGASVREAINALDQNITPDLIAEHIRQTLHHLAETTGQISSQTILNNLFSRFCIGK